MQLVWVACKTYTPDPGALIRKNCDTAQGVFERLWAAAGLPGLPPSAYPKQNKKGKAAKKGAAAPKKKAKLPGSDQPSPPKFKHQRRKPARAGAPLEPPTDGRAFGTNPRSPALS